MKKLMHVLNRLVDLGNTVLIIEHHLDVIKQADWIIDLGPEGGEGGGRIVAQGTPEQVARNKKSYTGQALPLLMPPAEGTGGWLALLTSANPFPPAPPAGCVFFVGFRPLKKYGFACGRLPLLGGLKALLAPRLPACPPWRAPGAGCTC